MSNKKTYIIAAALLIFVGVITVLSIRNDSLTMDELSHLPAGYSYLTQKDMRINPEHPPLIKDLAAAPLLLIEDINFPYEAEGWKEEINGQWTYGNSFLFKSSNPAEKMIFLGRLPMILILMLLGFYVFLWTRELFGNKAALISLFLYSFSPTLLAHGRLITTDVGAAAGAFISIYYFVKFLKYPNGRNIIFAGIALGLAELAKFSLILLFPLFGILLLIAAIVKSRNKKEFLGRFLKYLGLTILVGLIALAVIWVFYLYHTWNYPPERQVKDTEYILSSFGSRFLADTVVWMADKPVLKALGHYILGIFMVLQRASGGNTGYFLGEVSNLGWRAYFPTVYFIKETLVFHILSLIALIYAFWRIRRPLRNVGFRIFGWVKFHLAELAMLLFIAIYWTTSLTSNLNIGVRHLLPVFPFTISLVGGMTGMWLGSPKEKIKKAFLIWLVLWQALSIITIYPHFLAYFNEAVGGSSQGYKYVVDSNLDWGQDLKRLGMWMDEEGINKVYLDYFGGSDAEYYLKDRYLSWHGGRSPKELPKGSYLAVSATFLQGGRGEPVPGFKEAAGYYSWLDSYAPVKRMGYSIFVYYID